MKPNLEELKNKLNEFLLKIENTPNPIEDKFSILYAHYANKKMEDLQKFISELKPNSFVGDKNTYYGIFVNTLNRVLALPMPYTNSEFKKIHRVINLTAIISRAFYPYKSGEVFRFYIDCSMGKAWREISEYVNAICKAGGYNGQMVFESYISPHLDRMCELRIGSVDEDLIAAEDYTTLVFKKIENRYLIEVEVEGVNL